MLEAEQQFRRVIGHKDLAKLAHAVEREVTLPKPNPDQTDETAIVAAAQSHHTGPPPKFHAIRDIFVLPYGCSRLPVVRENAVAPRYSQSGGASGVRQMTS
jgi:hypothetical protein